MSHIPAPLARALGTLPPYPGSVLFAAGLNAAVAPKLPADVRAAMEGKSVRIHVIDAQLRFDVLWRGTRFYALRNAAPDLSIGASAADFVLLAQRREDPDTLFFGRRLLMEGDTELGLLIKNTLDAIDGNLFDASRYLPAWLVARVRQGAPHAGR